MEGSGADEAASSRRASRTLACSSDESLPRPPSTTFQAGTITGKMRSACPLLRAEQRKRR